MFSTTIFVGCVSLLATGHGAMFRARSFANYVAACRAVSGIPIGVGILEKYHVSLLSILGHCFNIVF